MCCSMSAVQRGFQAGCMGGGPCETDPVACVQRLPGQGDSLNRHTLYIPQHHA